MKEDFSQVLEKANCWAFIERYQKAADILDRVLFRSNESSPLFLHFRRVEISFYLQDLDCLDQKYQELSIKNAKMSGDIYLCRTFIQKWKDEIPVEQIMSQFKEIMSFYGVSAAALFGVGLCLIEQGKYERAVLILKESLQKDSHWFPSYLALSQIYDVFQDQKQAMSYLNIYEKSVPYQIKGRQEIHERLSNYFISEGLFIEAEIAIRSLSDWFVWCQGKCPIELKVYEKFSLMEISNKMGSKQRAKVCRETGWLICQNILSIQNKKMSKGSLFFIATFLQKVKEFDLSITFFQKIIQDFGDDDLIVRTIFHQISFDPDHIRRKSVFERGHKEFPDQKRISYYLMILVLKEKGVLVQEYLKIKEKILLLEDVRGKEEEVIEYGREIQEIYREDADIHRVIAKSLEQTDKLSCANKYYEKMYILDSHAWETKVVYLKYLIRRNKLDLASKVLLDFSFKEISSSKKLIEQYSLFSFYYLKMSSYKEASVYCERGLNYDSWNLNLIVIKTFCLLQEENKSSNSLKERLSSHLEDFMLREEIARKDELRHILDRYLEMSIKNKNWEIAFYLIKLQIVTKLISCLINDNILLVLRVMAHQKVYKEYISMLKKQWYEDKYVFYLLGFVSKEIQKFEISQSWFEQCLELTCNDEPFRNHVLIELTDTLLWKGNEGKLALYYLEMTPQNTSQNDERFFINLLHAYISSGNLEHASHCIKSEEFSKIKSNLELNYLLGLYLYKRKEYIKSKQIWNYILSCPAVFMKDKLIKNHIMKYISYSS